MNTPFEIKERRPRAVHFGPGNIGRGFIGLRLSRSGYDVCFVSRNEKQVAMLKSRGGYPVYIAGGDPEMLEVDNISAVHARNTDAVARRIVEAALVTTAVGASNLKDIAATIARGIVLRMQHTDEPLHIIACENAVGASTKLKKWVFKHLPADLHDQAHRQIAFPDSAIDRIVPTKKHDDPLAVTVEPYYEWAIDRSAIIMEGSLPEIEGALYVDSLLPFIERKLFTVNTGHAAAAYFGYLAGHKTIQQTMADPALLRRVRLVMQETGKMLAKKHNLDETNHQKYIHKILERFANPQLIDEVVRVGRSPIRKLSPGDRLIKPLMLAYDMGMETTDLISAIAAAMLFDPKLDQEASRLQADLRQQGVQHVIRTYFEIPSTHPLHQKIAARYREYVQKYRLAKVDALPSSFAAGQVATVSGFSKNAEA
ncbi:mannitol-1-phosphate 5-dehydrogenase [Paenibacillus sp. IB182496]|uniref:Mannitol-1-phosphate 5-dehydrogenase n=2 Tax=Paenibacillus sabuli TaxID=2772509 RepID=A0A927BT33_9BACL|nr:mannitol-1-phosphate 5-dehydrogenase [Paenibacillus sabuli]